MPETNVTLLDQRMRLLLSDQTMSVSRDLGGYSLHWNCILALDFETHGMSGLCAEHWLLLCL